MTLRLGAMVSRAVDAVLPSFPHVIPVAVWDGVCTRLRSTVVDSSICCSY